MTTHKINPNMANHERLIQGTQMTELHQDLFTPKPKTWHLLAVEWVVYASVVLVFALPIITKLTSE